MVQEDKGVAYVRTSDDTTSHLLSSYEVRIERKERLETYHRRNRLDRVTPLGIEFEPTSNIFLLKECGQRLRRLCAAKDPKRDPRLRLSICNLEDVLCRLTTEVNGLSEGITAGIWGELRARGWCRTRSNGESPVAGRGRRVHGEGKDMGIIGQLTK